MSDDIPLRTPAYRVSRPRGMDPATRRLALIAAGLGGALLVLIGVWSMSRSGGGSTGLPVIAPPAGPLRVKPANPGGLKVAGADQSIFQPSPNGRDAAQGSLMPGPERPDLQALRAPGPDVPGRPGAPTDSGAAAGAGPTPGPAALATQAAAPAAADLPLPPAFPPAPSVTAQAATMPAGAITPRATLPVATAPARPGADSGTTVQLAALPTRAAAEAEWRALRRRLPGLLEGRRLVLAQARVGGRIWWRVRTAGFADPAQARSFCARMRAAGAACDVTPL